MKPAVLICTVPTTGHVNHAVALAQILRENSFACDLVTGPEMTRYCREMALPVECHFLDSLSLDFAMNAPGRISHFRQVLAPDHVRQSYSELGALVRERPVDLLVTKDYVSPMLVARQASIPCAVYLTDGVDPLLDEGISARKRPSSSEQMAFLDAAQALGCDAPDDLPVKPYAHADAILARGVPETTLMNRPNTSLLDRTSYVGLATYDGSSGLIEEWRQRLSGLGTPLIYVTFGTVCHDLELYRRILRASASLEATVLLTTGHFTPADLGRIPINVVAERYVPNEAALSVADAVLHHGGFGTTLSALKLGVPSVVVPLNSATSAQGLHATKLTHLGVGLAVVDLDSNAIAAALREVLRPSFKATAIELSRALRLRSAEEQGRAVETLRRALTRKRSAGGTSA